MIPELRCPNADCPSRHAGKRGKLLGQDLEGRVTLYCQDCRQRYRFDFDGDPPQREQAA